MRDTRVDGIVRSIERLAELAAPNLTAPPGLAESQTDRYAAA
ncbi:MAG: hypothetical protein ACXVQ6_02415 [Actinomycetota bacterium]